MTSIKEEIQKIIDSYIGRVTHIKDSNGKNLETKIRDSDGSSITMVTPTKYIIKIVEKPQMKYVVTHFNELEAKFLLHVLEIELLDSDWEGNDRGVLTSIYNRLKYKIDENLK